MKNDELVHHQLITTKKGESDDYSQMLYIRDCILELIKEYRVTVVSIEALSLGSISSSTRTLAMIYGLVVLSIHEKHPDIFLLEVPPTTLKKYWTGSGRAKKEDMFNATPKHITDLFQVAFKKTTGLYDLVDSYALATYGNKCFEELSA